KSNVVDAISWVLGEQSHKSLRAERMADCIFNGTVKRPPMGLAEVTITMEDPELAEAARFVLEGSTDAAANGNPTGMMAPVDENGAGGPLVGGDATPVLTGASDAGGGPEVVNSAIHEASGITTDAPAESDFLKGKRKKKCGDKPVLASKPGEVVVSRR